jgi:hypothetical protein
VTARAARFAGVLSLAAAGLATARRAASAEDLPSPGPAAAAVAAPAHPRAAFVRRWLLVGPFPNADDRFLDEALAPESEVRPRAGERAGGRTWVEHRTSTDVVSPEHAVGRFDWGGACAFTWLHARESADVVLEVGHDDSARVYLDGERVHDHHFHAPSPTGGVRIPLRLGAGVHRLLVKIEDVEDDCWFWLRIGRPDGTPAPVVPALAPDLDDAEWAANAQAQPGFLSLDEVLRHLPASRGTRLGFDHPGSVAHVASAGSASPHWPHWVGFARPAGRRGPPAGFRGAVGLHPPVEEGRGFARLFWKVRLPTSRSIVLARVSGEAGESKGRAAALLRIGAFGNGRLRWIAQQVVGGRAPDWETVEARLAGPAGSEALLVLDVAYADEPAWEEVYVDSLEVR